MYASASGDSNNEGCKRCPEDTQVADNPALASFTGFTVPTMYKYSPAGSEGEDSCIDEGYCMYGEYWNGEEYKVCPLNTYFGYKWDGSQFDGSDPDLPAFADGDENNVCLDCLLVGNLYWSDFGSLECYPVNGD